jgi:hypothetical protein
MSSWLDEVFNSELTLRWFVGLHLLGAGIMLGGYLYDECSRKNSDGGEVAAGIGMLIMFGFWAYITLMMVLRLIVWVVTGE